MLNSNNYIVSRYKNKSDTDILRNMTNTIPKQCLSGEWIRGIKSIKKYKSNYKQKTISFKMNLK